MNKASSRTRNNLKGVHENLVMVVSYALAISEVDFFVSEGVRSLERQKELYAQGRTKPGNKVTNCDGVKSKSNHQVKADGKGHAVDIYYVGWKNTDPTSDPRWEKLFSAFKKASEMLGVGIEIGAYWKMRDFPHIELK